MFPQEYGSTYVWDTLFMYTPNHVYTCSHEKVFFMCFNTQEKEYVSCISYVYRGVSLHITTCGTFP